MADHPVKVPPELVRRLREEAASSTAASQLGTGHARQDHFIEYIADRAAQWGADQELEACIQLLDINDQELEACIQLLDINGCPDKWIDMLRAAMRPKPPTLAEQGLKALGPAVGLKHFRTLSVAEQDDIRTALNRLAELEAQQ